MATLKAQIKGGQARARQSRQEALDRYYKNPNRCLNCNKVIEVKPSGKVQDARRQNSVVDPVLHSSTIESIQNGNLLLRRLARVRNVLEQYISKPENKATILSENIAQNVLEISV